MEHHADSILIVDFGSQVTQLIARRVREAGVYSEIAPFNSAAEAFARMQPKGIILSGSPASVLHEESPRVPQVIFDSGLPILGICYGQQVMMHQLGGEVQLGDSGEFGLAFIEIEDSCVLFDGLWSEGEKHQVWMSHGDRVEALPEGFSVVAASEGAPYAVATDEARREVEIPLTPLLHRGRGVGHTETTIVLPQLRPRMEGGQGDGVVGGVGHVSFLLPSG